MDNRFDVVDVVVVSTKTIRLQSLNVVAEEATQGEVDSSLIELS